MLAWHTSAHQRRLSGMFDGAYSVQHTQTHEIREKNSRFFRLPHNIEHLSDTLAHCNTRNHANVRTISTAGISISVCLIFVMLCRHSFAETNGVYRTLAGIGNAINISPLTVFTA